MCVRSAVVQRYKVTGWEKQKNYVSLVIRRIKFIQNKTIICMYVHTRSVVYLLFICTCRFKVFNPTCNNAAFLSCL